MWHLENQLYQNSSHSQSKTDTHGGSLRRHVGLELYDSVLGVGATPEMAAKHLKYGPSKFRDLDYVEDIPNFT